jgi:hypothetical protein
MKGLRILGNPRVAKLCTSGLMLSLPLVAEASVIAGIGIGSTGLTPVSQMQTALSGSVSLNGSLAGANASSFVAPGVIKLSGGAGQGQNSGQTGQFSDTNVTIWASGLPTGAPLSVTMGFSIGGQLSESPLGCWCAADWAADFSFNGFGSEIGGWSGHLAPTPTGPPLTYVPVYTGDPLGVKYSKTFSIFNGTGYTLQVGLTGQAEQANGPAPLILGIPYGTATDDLAHSLYWAGISSVTSNGMPVSSFTVTSDSGTDWSQSFVPGNVSGPGPTGTPEPGTFVLVAMLLGGVWLVRRKASLS